jgi:FADH2 O2-dependent halogenase
LASQLAPDLADNPLSRVTLNALLASARLAAFPGKLYRSGRLQHFRDRASGDGWAALPFTAGFIDPLHSTGIAHSLSGVARLAQALCQSSWQKRHGELAEYGRQLPWEIKHLDNLISLCYESLEDFELFCSSSMLYFAAATTYERLHSQGLQPSFLLANDECFNQVVAQAQSLMEGRKQVRDEKQLLAANQNYTLQIQQLVEPFNHVGLFDPAAHNMYRHTVAP